MENTRITLFGRTYPAHLPAAAVRTLDRCSKKSRKPQTGQFAYLDLSAGDGHLPEKSWEMVTVSPTGHTMRNFGVSPSADVESFLSQILEADAPEKYNLSAKGCLGVLRRAEEGGKKLPEKLETALMWQAGVV